MGSLRAFFGLAYLLTWGLLAPFFYLISVLHQPFPWWLWVLVPFAFIGGSGPSAAALVVTGWTQGRQGVRRLLASLAAWRVPARWYLFALGLPPAATALSVLIVDGGLQTLRRFDPAAALRGLPLAYALALPFGPLGEELGWRGYALPRLLDRFDVWKATLLLGVLWTFWHVPMMLLRPGASIPAFLDVSPSTVALYLGQVVSGTAMLTLLFLRTRGSVLLAVLCHLGLNTAESVVFNGLPDLPDLQIRQTYFVNVAVLGCIAVACLVLAARRTNPRADRGSLQAQSSIQR
jgi:membrane protease YdiL (CAAX protease family)